MSKRRTWALVIGLAGVGSLLTALASLLADRPAFAVPLGVVGGVLAAVGGAMTVSAATPSVNPPPPPDRPRVVFGAIPQLARWFQARPAEQGALADALAGNSRAALVALPGARGAGKSQLAADLARRCEADGYDVVAWINAEAGPVTDLARLAVELGVATPDQSPEDAALLAIKAVSAVDGKRRLIVFDNVDDPDDLVRYLPRSGTVKVVVTTNRQEFTTMAGVIPVEVGMFTPAQGIEFLSGATGLSDPDSATMVGTRLGWLPLGLSQAAAYMRLNHLTYRQYLSKLDSLPLDEALQRQSGSLHPGIVGAVRLTLENLGDSDAANLLAVLSCLAPEGISRHLLMKPRALDALGLTDATASHALSRLVNTSLVALADTGVLDEDPVVVVVHRLTAAIVRHMTGSEQFDVALNTATTLFDRLAAELPDRQLALRRGELDEVVLHLNAIHRFAVQPILALFVLRDWAGNALRQVGAHQRAITMLEQNVTDGEGLLGPEHPDVLTSRNNLAYAYDSAGRVDEAVALHERTLADSERTLGADHPNTLISREHLAYAYYSADRIDDALALFGRNLADCERILGPDHPHTLTSRNNLANAYRSAGRHDDAIALHQRTLTDQERVLGPDHPDTLRSRNNLATAYYSAGRDDDAISLYESNLADRERILGPDHPDTLNSRNNLANAYASVGRHDDAISLYESNLADRERILGPDHPDTVNSRQSLANAYRSAGRPGDADRLQ